MTYPRNQYRPKKQRPIAVTLPEGPSVPELEASSLLPLLERALNAGTSVFLRGHPGIGKSQIAAQLAGRMGKTLVDVRLSQKEPAELHGIYTKNEDKGLMERLPLEWIDQVVREPCLLFLDELNAAPTNAHQAAAYEIVLERRAAGRDFHPGTVVLAAGNLEEDQAIVRPLSSALRNRFLHFILKPSRKDWLQWATQRELDERIIEFIRATGDRSLFCPDDGYAFPTPRSWEMLHHVLRIQDDENPGDKFELEMLAAAAVGKGAARAFVKFTSLNFCCDPDAIVHRGELPNLKRGRFADTSAKLALMNEVLHFLRDHIRCAPVELTEDNVEHVIELMEDDGMTDELRAQFIRKVGDCTSLSKVLPEFSIYDSFERHVRAMARGSDDSKGRLQ